MWNNIQVYLAILTFDWPETAIRLGLSRKNSLSKRLSKFENTNFRTEKVRRENQSKIAGKISQKLARQRLT